MQYQSIIRILNHCDIDCKVLDVAKAKRILAAEFSLAPSGIISIDGFDYTKNDVFNELEDVDFAQLLQIHILIWRTPVLLNFLEKSESPPAGKEDEFRYYVDSRRFLSDFISPYFAVSFSKVMGRLLNEARFNEACSWRWRLYDIDNEYDRRVAMSSTTTYLTDFIKLLKNINDVTYKNHLLQLEKFFSQQWSSFVNFLPDTFYGITNELLSSMHNFTLIIKHTDRELCRKMSRQMIEVRNIEPELRELIAREHDYMQVIGHNRVNDICEHTNNGGRVIFCDCLFHEKYLCFMG